MDGTLHDNDFSKERRARLAAERLLEQKQAELKDANRKLSDHALSLSGQIIDQRRMVQDLQGQHVQVSQDLEVANNKAITFERLLWDALETIRDGFALFDPDFRLITANRPYLKTLEQAQNIAPGISYQTILDLCLDDGLIDLQGQDEDEWYNFMLDRWEAPSITPVTVRLWNGVYVKMMDRRTSEGGIVSLALNITDTIAREEELKEASNKAQAADRAKSTFLAKMSHELRTPMNGVVGMADLLLENNLDEESTLYASTIKNSSEALLEIINDVLDFSKIEADKLELKPVHFDLERVIHDVALIVEPTIQQKNIRLDVDYDQFLPIEFMGDPVRIRQILTNLVGNAVKFTDQGHVLIRVVGLQATSGEYQLHITVEDTGIGIDADMVEHIFGEFNQIDDQTTRKYEGTGLGLAISKRLIEQMGGDVWLESVKGQGSCFGFKLVLPMAQGTSGDVTTLPPYLRTALAIIPNHLERQTLKRQLSLLGLAVECCESTKALGKDFLSHLPDIVFLEHGSMCQDGLKLANNIRTRFPDIPVVLITPISKMGDLSEYPLILPKPIQRQKLHSLLSTLGRPATTTARPIKILAAEDNKTNQLVFTKMLKGLNFELTMANNGAEAVDAYQNERPDIVFMDISMPGMDGIEATKLIRQFETTNNLTRTPIIAMTAHALKGDEDRIKQSGVDYYLTKPLKKDVIHKLIHDISSGTHDMRDTA